MGVDEEGTLAKLKACRRDLIDPGIARHQGRIVKTTGDGILIEFFSPVEALRCAVELQQGMISRNADLLDDKRIRFRIGINLGDVIVDDKDLYGDAVNVAARLESLAEPGGICISRAMYDQIRDRLALPFDDGGEQSVRNIARPVGVYALSAEAIAALPQPEVRAAFPKTGSHYERRNVVALALAGLLILGGGVWWLWSSQKMPLATVTATPVSTAPLRVPRLSIVVLPFANLSDDRGQQHFADGVTEDLTTDLSQLSGLAVISRNTAFTYKGKTVDAKQIGRELAVRYVLEGSVQRSGSRVRITAQLIDAETDAHLWAERFDRDTADLFAIQNEITSRIAIALNVTMIGMEAARPTTNPDALDYFFRGRVAGLNKTSSPETYAERISMMERALALDPQLVDAQSLLAVFLAGRAMDRMASFPAADIARAESLADDALAASPRSALAHFAKGQVLRAQAQVLRVQGRCVEAIPEYERAIALNRNMVFAITALAWCKFLTGSIDEVIPLNEQAIRLSPGDSNTWNWYQWTGSVHLLQSRVDESIVWFEKSRTANPVQASVRASLAAAYGLKGETELAAAELAEARRLSGNDSYSSISRLQADRYWGVPKIRALHDATYFLGLRKAGMPEE
jgi:TolB-like protein